MWFSDIYRINWMLISAAFASSKRPCSWNRAMASSTVPRSCMTRPFGLIGGRHGYTQNRKHQTTHAKADRPEPHVESRREKREMLDSAVTLIGAMLSELNVQVHCFLLFNRYSRLKYCRRSASFVISREMKTSQHEKTRYYLLLNHEVLEKEKTRLAA